MARFVCHQCGRSFAEPIRGQLEADSIQCPLCNSEFIEEQEPFMHTFSTTHRQGRGEGEPSDGGIGRGRGGRGRGSSRRGRGRRDKEREGSAPAESDLEAATSTATGTETESEEIASHYGDDADDNYNNGDGDQDQEEESFLDNNESIGFAYRNGHQDQQDAQAHYNFYMLPVGFVFDPNNWRPLISNAPITIGDIFRLVVHPATVSATDPLWASLGLQGNPGDYATSETAFQRILQQLLDQSGRQVVGLNEEQVERLDRYTFTENGPRSPIDQICAICQDPYHANDSLVHLACAHEFHADCIIPWLRRVASCPVCRFSLLSDQ